MIGQLLTHYNSDATYSYVLETAYWNKYTSLQYETRKDWFNKKHLYHQKL